MSRTYEECLPGFAWQQVADELGHRTGDPLNIGWYCSDRICQQGKAAKTALLWEDFRGEKRTYSFDDLRQLTNTFAQYLEELDVKPGERVCLFMDRAPELYLGFLGVLKMGGIVQPLFSAFGEDSLWTRLDNAGACTVVTQKKHVRKVRKIIDRLPNLRHVVVVDADPAKPLKERETALDLHTLPRIDEYTVHATT
ncbi:MAG: AMP-binding protein, partial [Candidatus Krumholzibacteria bacterium]|nr:AMP-binding protein [Candidatus Krumholzibacteria bacterium]